MVAAIRKGSAKEALVMHLLRSLWFFAAYFDIHMYAIHIPGACNVAADQLSRYNMSNFFHSNPQANWLPTPLPLELLQIVSMTGPDWTSQAFGWLFSDTISRVWPHPHKSHTKQGKNDIILSAVKQNKHHYLRLRTPCYCSLGIWQKMVSLTNP